MLEEEKNIDGQLEEGIANTDAADVPPSSEPPAVASSGEEAVPAENGNAVRKPDDSGNSEDDAREEDEDDAHELRIPDSLPVMGIDNFVLFPFMIAPMIVGQENTKLLVNDALQGTKLVGIFLKKDAGVEESFENLHEVGTLAVMLKMLRMPDGSIRLLLHGIDRIGIREPLSSEPYLRARVERLRETNSDTLSVQAMIKSVQQQLVRISQMGHLSEDLSAAVLEMHDAGKLADLAISNVQVKVQERQEMLATSDVEKRLTRVMEILNREIELLELGSEIQNKVASKMDKHQRDFMLREQIKTIRKELGEDDDNLDLEDLKAAVEKADLPEHARKTADKELSRLKSMHPSSPEYSVSRTYLDWIVSLPWNISTPDNIQIDQAKRILDEDHYNLSDVKERVLEYLSVIKLKKQIRGPILCFVGPPGVGKTSLGRSIARAMGRKFHRMSVGGMRDEAEIRGHRRTYIGSLPGRLIKAIKDCGENNPLIMIDEIDKIGNDFRGDPASALLEVLDPEQNFSFTDHYLDMPFDLSKVMFITTANVLDPIPSPLRDRMEILKLSGYTQREKSEIARRYLIPRNYDNCGIEKKHIRFTDEGLARIIENYTSEAGVRNLDREIGNICRKVARNVAQSKYQNVTLRPSDVEAYLGPQRYFHEIANRTARPGVSIGLAWTQTGGEILFIEAVSVPGTGQLLLTGQLGEVMKESAMAAMNHLHSCAESLGIADDLFSKQNFHLHVPAGATPKDGPSAGVAMAVAFCSLLLGQPVKDKMAMTGEITLKGNILPVGGIKEKVLAAHRAGIKEICLPSRCEAELKKDVPEEVRRAIHFYFVEHIQEVLKIAFPGRALGKAEEKRDRQENNNRHESRQENRHRGGARPEPVPAAALPESGTPAEAAQDDNPALGIDWDALDDEKKSAGPSNLRVESGPSRPPLRIEPEHGKRDLHRHHKPRVSAAFTINEEEVLEASVATPTAPPEEARETNGTQQRQGRHDRDRRHGRHERYEKKHVPAPAVEKESPEPKPADVPRPLAEHGEIAPGASSPEIPAAPEPRAETPPVSPETSAGAPETRSEHAQAVEPVNEPAVESAELTESPAAAPREKAGFQRRGRRGRPPQQRGEKAATADAPASVTADKAPAAPAEEAEAKPASRRRGRPPKAAQSEPGEDVTLEKAPAVKKVTRRGRPSKKKDDAE